MQIPRFARSRLEACQVVREALVRGDALAGALPRGYGKLTALVVWFVERACDQPMALLPVRSWYTHKANLSFEDALRVARHDLATDVSDLLCRYENLAQGRRRSLSSSTIARRPQAVAHR